MENATKRPPGIFSQLRRLIGARAAHALKQQIGAELRRPLTIAIVGKAGVGKTTTVNNLFNTSWTVSHTVAGTYQAQSVDIPLAAGRTLRIVDMPGLGEDIQADQRYLDAYAQILPGANIILWVMQANAKDLAEDQRLIREVVVNQLPELTGRIVVGLNQVDKLGPGAWNERLNAPSREQAASIQRREAAIARSLHAATGLSADRIVAYAALRRYRLYPLLSAVVSAAGALGWKVPVDPRDPLELVAEPELRRQLQTLRDA